MLIIHLTISADKKFCNICIIYCSEFKMIFFTFSPRFHVFFMLLLNTLSNLQDDNILLYSHRSAFYNKEQYYFISYNVVFFSWVYHIMGYIGLIYSVMLNCLYINLYMVMCL